MGDPQGVQRVAPYVKATFAGGGSTLVWIGPVRIGHFEWNKHRETPFTRFVPTTRCPAHLAHIIELRGPHTTMALRRMIWEKQAAHAAQQLVEWETPIPLPAGAAPLQMMYGIARDLMLRGSDSEDRRQGRRLMGALQALNR